MLLGILFILIVGCWKAWPLILVILDLIVGNDSNDKHSDEEEREKKRRILIATENDLL